MNNEELRKYMEKASGLPSPPDNASQETFEKYFVAYVFMIAIRNRKDKAAAGIWAANTLLEDSAYQGMLPHIEEAFGRKLAPEEIAARHIVSIQD